MPTPTGNSWLPPERKLRNFSSPKPPPTDGEPLPGFLQLTTQMARLRKDASFWTPAILQLVIVFASAAATPLYRVYQVELGFSPTTLTAIFAVYAFVLLATLLFFGSLSDYVGRRPLVLAALG